MPGLNTAATRRGSPVANRPPRLPTLPTSARPSVNPGSTDWSATRWARPFFRRIRCSRIAARARRYARRPRHVQYEQLPLRRRQHVDVRRLGEVPQEQHRHAIDVGTRLARQRRGHLRRRLLSRASAFDHSPRGYTRLDCSATLFPGTALESMSGERVAHGPGREVDRRAIRVLLNPAVDAALQRCWRSWRSGDRRGGRRRRPARALDDVAIRRHPRRPAPLRRRAGLPPSWSSIGPSSWPRRPVSRYLVVAEIGGKVLSFPDDPGADHAEVALDLAARGQRIRCALRPGVPSQVRGEPAGFPLLHAARRSARRHPRLAVRGARGSIPCGSTRTARRSSSPTLGGPQRRLPCVRPGRLSLYLHR